MMPGAELHEIRQLRQEQLCIKPKMASLLDLDLDDLVESIEHGYIRNLKFQSYKQIPIQSYKQIPS